LRLERVVRPAGPYSLVLSSRHATDATRSVRDGVLGTTLLVDGGRRAELARAFQRHDGSVVLQADSEEGLERLRFVLAVDDDHSEFLRRFRNDELIGPTTLRFAGMRQVRLPTVAQTLLRAFCGQLIETRRARQLEVRIVRATTGPVGASGLYAPPTAGDFARYAPARLRQLGLHARRAAALVRICRATDVERLHELSTDAAADWVMRQRGLGPWSAGVVCLEGLGRYERGIEGDLTLIKLMSRLRGRWVEAAETAELLEPYGEWAGLASIYLALGFARGLLPLPDRARPRRPQARARTAPAPT
jgi:3-methyladenine DNA glycosylase/8-oxoguanine DNA glycosylase